MVRNSIGRMFSQNNNHTLFMSDELYQFLGDGASAIYKVNGALYNKERDRDNLNRGVNFISCQKKNIIEILIKGSVLFGLKAN